MHPTIVRNCIYFPIQRALGKNVKKIIPSLRSTERLHPGPLRTFQEKKLRDLIASAFDDTPYYRENHEPGSLEKLKKEPFEALSLMPIMTKEKIRNNLQSLTSPKWRSSWRSTSGTTGSPFVFRKDRFAALYMDAAMHAVYSWHGIEIGDREGRIWGSAVGAKKKAIQTTKDFLLNRKRLSAFGMTPEKSRAYYEKLKRFRPAYIYCYPNAAYLFARHMQELGVPAKELGLKTIICTGELLLEQHREVLRDTFGCPVINEYGTTENGILAIECEMGNLHMLAGNVILEFVKNGSQVEDGEVGDILVTELNSRSIPFIRYKTGDMGRPLFSKKCSCGRIFPIMEVVEGRIDDFIVRPDGEKVYDAILAYVLKKSVLQFRATQESLKELVIEIVVDERFSSSLEAQYKKKLQDYCGSSMEISFRKVDKIDPDKSGKLRYFVSKIKDKALTDSDE